MTANTLARLCGSLAGAAMPPGSEAIRVGRVRDDSRTVEPGDVFVAVRGAATSGVEHAAEAVARGAAAIVVEDGDAGLARDAHSVALVDAGARASVPVVRVPDARIALAELAAVSLGRPADQLRLIGITGTVGKTSVLAMLSAIMARAGITAGSIGSLGITHLNSAAASLNTTPGALTIQEALRAMVDQGVSVAAMEVTSHALVQERVHGLHYDLGIFTNLTMLEHLEYHGSFRDYAAAKLRFIDRLKPDAPLCYSAGDRVVRQAARRHTGPRVSCGGGSAWIGVRRDALTLRGTRITLNVRRPLPRLDGSRLAPFTLPLELQMLGRPNTSNATLAAAAGLVAGAEPDAVRDALAAIRPPRRRLEVIRDSGPIIIDDTVGHPDSITGVFELAEGVPHRQLRVVFCIRGRRGEAINARDAEALAIWSRRVRIDMLHITSAEDTADERNTVTTGERRAFLDVLKKAGTSYTYHPRVEDAVPALLDGAGRDDLILLLGAQGMDAAAGMVSRRLG